MVRQESLEEEPSEQAGGEAAAREGVKQRAMDASVRRMRE